jgi:hypothetical protein
MNESGPKDVEDYMRSDGILSGSAETLRWDFGFDTVKMQTIHPALEHDKNHSTTTNIMHKTCCWINNLHVDCLVLQDQDRRSIVGMRVPFTNVGYQAIALGLNALCHGTMSPNYHVDNIATALQAMQAVERQILAHWFLAISMCTETQNAGPSSAWRLFLPPSPPPAAPTVSHEDAISINESVDSDATMPMSPIESHPPSPSY